MVNRTAERLHLAHLLAHVPELAEATIDQDGERPEPVRLPDRTIGRELTESFHSKAKGTIGQREREMFQRRAVAEAQRGWIFEANGGPPLHVSVGWYGRIVTGRRDLLARAIADVVGVRLPDVPV